MKQKLKRLTILLATSVFFTVIAKANDQPISQVGLDAHIPKLSTPDVEHSPKNTEPSIEIRELRLDTPLSQESSETDAITTVESENTIGETDQLAVEKIKSNEMGRWVVDGYEIYVDIKCNISRSNFIPTKDCYPPRMVIDNHRGDLHSLPQPLYFMLTTKNIEIGDKSAFEGDSNPNKMVSISDIRLGAEISEDLFNLLISEPNVKLSFMTKVDSSSAIKARTIILSDFKPHTNKLIAEINYHYDQEESRARSNLLLALAGCAIFLSITIWLAIIVIKRARKQLTIIKQHIETRHVSRVAEDEAIRTVVRNSIKKSDDKSVDALRSQIKSALDSGDTKTAKELLNILTHLEQS